MELWNKQCKQLEPIWREKFHKHLTKSVDVIVFIE